MLGERWGVVICAAVHNTYYFYKSLEVFGRVNMVRNLDLKVKRSVCQRGQILIGNQISFWRKRKIPHF